MAKPLAEIIYKKINFSNCGGSTSRIIIPVPLSGKRFRERGFNQTELIARHLSDKLKPNFSVLNNVLYKNKDTISQVEIKNRKERLRNLKNTFSVKNSGLIKNEVIFVLDDVTTTSATINEARRALLKAGAKKVIGLVVAR